MRTLQEALAAAKLAQARGEGETLQSLLAKGARKGGGKGIRCAACGCPETRVAWTRKASGGIKRVRVCAHCGGRFPTFETI